MGLKSKLKTEFDLMPAIWSEARLKTKLWSKLIAKTRLLSTFGLRLELNGLKVGIPYVKCISFGLKP